MELNPTDIFNTLRLLGVSEGEKGLKEEEMVQLAIEVKYVSRPQQLLKYICCLPTTTEKRRTISSTFSLNGQNGKGEKKGWAPFISTHGAVRVVDLELDVSTVNS